MEAIWLVPRLQIKAILEQGYFMVLISHSPYVPHYEVARVTLLYVGPLDIERTLHNLRAFPVALAHVGCAGPGIAWRTYHCSRCVGIYLGGGAALSPVGAATVAIRWT